MTIKAFSSSFLCWFLMFFTLPVLPGPTEAMSCVNLHRMLCPCEKDTDNETASCHGNAIAPHNTARAGHKVPATSSAPQIVATQEPGIARGENNRQSLLKTGLLNLGIRGVISSVDVIGAQAPEKFRAYDATATSRLPWAWYSHSGWGAGIRLITGVGTLTGGGNTGLVVSLTPLLALGNRDGRFSIDMGTGAALFSRTAFGTQDFGGYVQFTLTAGVGIPLFKGLGTGYRFVHYSDAAVYGSHTIGADLHMLEITYRF